MESFFIKKINFIHFLTTFIKPDTQLNTLYSQEPRVLVVDPATVGLQKNVQITNEDTKKITDLQNVFDKLFGNSLQGVTDLSEISNSDSTTEHKNNIILGKLRNILLICEVCKNKVPIMTTPPPGLCNINQIHYSMVLLYKKKYS